jgi:hypothetical protein
MIDDDDYIFADVYARSPSMIIERPYGHVAYRISDSRSDSRRSVTARATGEIL